MALLGALAEAVREGKEIVVGEAALDGSNPTPITHTFRVVKNVQLTLKGTSAPGLSTSVLTYDVSGQTLNVYGWMPTGATNPTLIASTGTETFSYMIVGIR